MKAAVYSKYGPPDVLQIKDVEKPVPKDNEVLIKVRSASVNPLDGGLMKGGGRVVTGLRKPKVARLGVQSIAGVGDAIYWLSPGVAKGLTGSCLSAEIHENRQMIVNTPDAGKHSFYAMRCSPIIGANRQFHYAVRD